MKGKDLIAKLQKIVDKYPDIEVFIGESGDYNVYKCSNYVEDQVAVDELSDFPDTEVTEYWGEEGIREGKGMIRGICISSDEQVTISDR